MATRVASDATASGKQAPPLYNVVTPLQSPFADTCEVSFTREQRPSTDGAASGAGTSGVGACQTAAAAMPVQALPPTRSSTERLTLRRKISSCKCAHSPHALLPLDYAQRCFQACSGLSPANGLFVIHLQSGAAAPGLLTTCLYAGVLAHESDLVDGALSLHDIC